MHWLKLSESGGEPYSEHAEIETLRESLYPPRQSIDQALSLPEKIKKLRMQTYSPGVKWLRTIRPPGHPYKEKYLEMREHNASIGGKNMKWIKEGQKEYFSKPAPHPKGTEIKSPWKKQPEITQGKPEVKSDTALPKKYVTRGPDGKIIINPRPFKQDVPSTKTEKPKGNITEGPGGNLRPYQASLLAAKKKKRPPRKALEALWEAAGGSKEKLIEKLKDEKWLNVLPGETREDAAARFSRWLEGYITGKYKATR